MITEFLFYITYIGHNVVRLIRNKSPNKLCMLGDLLFMYSEDNWMDGVGEMSKVLTIGNWQLSMMLTHARPQPDIKIPSRSEIRRMIKQAHRRFRKKIKELKREADERR